MMSKKRCITIVNYTISRVRGLTIIYNVDDVYQYTTDWLLFCLKLSCIIVDIIHSMMDLLIIKYEPFLRDVSAEVTVKAIGPFAELEALINICQTFKERYYKDFYYSIIFVTFVMTNCNWFGSSNPANEGEWILSSK